MKALAVVLVFVVGCVSLPSDDTRRDYFAPSSTLAEEAQIRAACEEERDGDWSSIAICVRTRTWGFREVQKFAEEHSIRDRDTTPQAQIVAKCVPLIGTVSPCPAQFDIS